MNRKNSLVGVCRLLAVTVFAGFVSACSTIAPPSAAVVRAVEVPVVKNDVQRPPAPVQQDVAPTAAVLSVETLDHTAVDPPAPTIIVAIVRVEPDKASLECMALALYHEARGEPRAGKVAVGFVILNRSQDARFPTSVCGVVQQRHMVKTKGTCEFSYYCTKNGLRVSDKSAYQQALDLARTILVGDALNPIGKCLYFHNVHVKAPRTVKYATRVKIGLHYFYA